MNLNLSSYVKILLFSILILCRFCFQGIPIMILLRCIRRCDINLILHNVLKAISPRGI